MIGIVKPKGTREEDIEETFQMLKIPWDYYTPGHKYDLVIVDIGENPPEGINNTRVVYISKIVYNRPALLSEVKWAAAPVPGSFSGIIPDIDIDGLIDLFRTVIKMETPLVEIPPVPWGHSHMVALTHDIDITSVKERKLISVGNAALQCLRQGKILHAARFLLAKLGIGKDPWDNLEEWMQMERDLGVRSTMFFIPYPDVPGYKAPDIRAGRYEITNELLKPVIEGGWEVGVHGIDAWTSWEAATREAIPTSIGHRTHWLAFGEQSWKALDVAGYGYDSTIGFNHDLFYTTLQVYRPHGTKQLLELPIHIQDLSLLGKQCWRWYPETETWKREECLNLSEREAKKVCNELFELVKKYGGVVTISWHNDVITPPRDWKEFYRSMVEERLKDGAWVARAIDITNWYRARRIVDLRSEKKDNILTIIVNSLNLDISPGMRLRVHIPMSRIKKIETPDLTQLDPHGEDWVDIKLQKGVTTIEMYDENHTSHLSIC